ncbi:type II toxin-antitoxin system YafQ family toxin [Candidatus Peribacteria bacterium]|nr:type II toxin-antitoxin system YafQ family toxin [Candidatus Peribacteria bacterium]
MPAYTLILTKRFRKDIRKLQRSHYYDLRTLQEAIDTLAQGRQLSVQYRDHPLRGNLVGRRECHLAPDWLLVYRKCERTLVLILLRTGSHADVFSE